MRILIKLREIDKAKFIGDMYLLSYPKSIAVKLELVVIAIIKNDNEEIKKITLEELESDETQKNFVLLIKLILGIYKSNLAEELLNIAIEKDPENPVLISLLITALFNQVKLSDEVPEKRIKAKELAIQMHEKYPDDKRITGQLIELHMFDRELGRAIRLIEDSLEKNSDDEYRISQKAKFLIFTKKYSEAEAFCRSALEKFPDCSYLASALNFALKKQEKPAEIEEKADFLNSIEHQLLVSARNSKSRKRERKNKRIFKSANPSNAEQKMPSIKVDENLNKSKFFELLNLIYSADDMNPIVEIINDFLSKNPNDLKANFLLI